MTFYMGREKNSHSLNDNTWRPTVTNLYYLFSSPVLQPSRSSWVWWRMARAASVFLSAWMERKRSWAWKLTTTGSSKRTILMSCEFFIHLGAAVYHSLSQFYRRQMDVVGDPSWWKVWSLCGSLNRVEKYLNGKREESARDIPLLFVGSPSSKDPTWEERSPGTATGCEAEVTVTARPSLKYKYRFSSLQGSPPWAWCPLPTTSGSRSGRMTKWRTERPNTRSWSRLSSTPPWTRWWTSSPR